MYAQVCFTRSPILRMSEIKSESTTVEQFVPVEKLKPNTDDNDVIGFTASTDSLPKGYYTSTTFLGSMLATGLGLNAGVAGYGLPAPVLGIINEDIGPDPDLIWVALGYSLTLAVGLTLFGRLSDIFGRRWCCIGGAILVLVGCIIGATAQSIHQLIGASAIIGLGGAAQLSFHFIIGELVPMKFRFVAIAGLFVFCIPASGLRQPLQTL
jgi:MFS family permease